MFPVITDRESNASLMLAFKLEIETSSDPSCRAVSFRPAKCASSRRWTSSSSRSLVLSRASSLSA